MLKHIDLSNSKDLITTPNITEAPNLEELILKGCTSLSEIHTSLEDHKKLILLNLDGCLCLERLPYKISLESLKIFSLRGCLSLKNFPEIVGNMSHLLDLLLDGTAIEGLPLSIKHLTGLTLLNLRNCKSLLSLPDTICCLTSLTSLTLSGCSKLDRLPKNLGNLTGLNELDVSETYISELPLLIKHLTGLTLLNLRNCKPLLYLPVTICCWTSLTSLNLSGCSRLDRLPKNLRSLTGLNVLDVSGTAIRELSSLDGLSNLTSLDLRDCKYLRIQHANCFLAYIGTLFGCSNPEDLPENILNLTYLEMLEIIGTTAVRDLPSSIVLMKNLKVRCLHGCEGTLSTRSRNLVRLELPSLSCLPSLVKLELRDCNLQAIPNGIGSSWHLEKLYISGNNFVCPPDRITWQCKLKEIYIENCTSFLSLTQIPLSTQSIWANGCASLDYLLNCFKLVDNQGFSDKFLKMLSRCTDISGKYRFDLIVAGRNIPKCFSHQSEGASVTLQVPPNFDEKFLAIGMCAAFEHLPSGLGGLFGCGSHDRTRHMLFCSIAFYPKGELYGSTAFNRKRISFPFHENFGQVESRHLWLIYLRREFFHKIKDRVYSKGLHGENGFVLQIKFKTEGTGLTVNKCGAHFVFKQDIEDLSKTNEMDFVFYDNHLNSEVPADGTSKVEPSHDGNYNGAGPSGQGSSNDGVGPRGKSSNDGAGPNGEGSSNGTTGKKRKRM